MSLKGFLIQKCWFHKIIQCISVTHICIMLYLIGITRNTEQYQNSHIITVIVIVRAITCASFLGRESNLSEGQASRINVATSWISIMPVISKSPFERQLILTVGARIQQQTIVAGKNYKQLLDSSSLLYPYTVTVISKRICTMTVKNDVQCC